MVSIYIDMDDVLCESNQTFLNILERDFGKKADYEEITAFDLKTSLDLSDDEYSRFFESIHDPDEMIRHKPAAGAKHLLDLWHDKGYRINVLTGRPAVAQPVSLEWLKKHDFKFHGFSIVDKYNRKSSRGDSSLTLEALSRQNFDLAVEDSGAMARFLSEEMGLQVALVDRPWNRSFSFNANVHRCRDWFDIKEKFENLS